MESTTVALLGAAIVVVLIAALFVVYHKLSSAIGRLDPQVRAHTENVFVQLEALLSLHCELALSSALPPTRGWAASPDFLRNVMVHHRRHRPAVTVECGSGVSTLILARCVQLNGSGHVFSLEHDPGHAAKTRQTLEQHGLQTFATVIDAPLQETQIDEWQGKWYAYQLLPQGLAINLLVIDGPPFFSSPLARYPAVPLLKPNLQPAAAVFLDDAARPDEQRCVELWLRNHPDLAAVAVPPCEKGCVALQLQGAKHTGL